MNVDCKAMRTLSPRAPPWSSSGLCSSNLGLTHQSKYSPTFFVTDLLFMLSCCCRLRGTSVGNCLRGTGALPVAHGSPPAARPIQTERGLLGYARMGGSPRLS